MLDFKPIDLGRFKQYQSQLLYLAKTSMPSNNNTEYRPTQKGEISDFETGDCLREQYTEVIHAFIHACCVQKATTKQLPCDPSFFKKNFLLLSQFYF